MVDRRIDMPLGKRSSRTGNVGVDEIVARRIRGEEEGVAYAGHVNNVRYETVVVRTGVGTDFHLIADATRAAVSTVRGVTSNMGRRFGLS